MPKNDSPSAPTCATLDNLAWCETSAAMGREHLRRLSDAGKKIGGGADTDTLCGLTPSWDLASPVTAASLRRKRDRDVYSFPCLRCVAVLSEGGGS